MTTDNMIIPHGKQWRIDGPGSPTVWTIPGGRIMVQRLEPGNLTPEQARELALILEEAAEYSAGPDTSYPQPRHAKGAPK